MPGTVFLLWIQILNPVVLIQVVHVDELGDLDMVMFQNYFYMYVGETGLKCTLYLATHHILNISVHVENKA